LDQDQETLFAKSRASHFEQGGRGLRQWVDAIVGQQPDVLLYPEIGMDSMTGRLASLRLAPVQVATWGHPETTGLPTIDYYLSAEGLEPANAQENYTERLVTLPRLGCFYEPHEFVAAPPDLANLGIDPESPLLLCPGVPFKYAPQHDWVFTEIARRLGRCQFVFFTHQASPNMSEKLRQRLEVEFARNRLDLDEFAIFIPWQNWPGFFGLLKRADVFLDTIGFSGFNTAMQAVECGLPVVTREGRFLRGRLASGILKQIGLQELVAQSEEDYIALVVKLVRDAGYREHIRERIEASRHILFEDVSLSKQPGQKLFCPELRGHPCKRHRAWRPILSGIAEFPVPGPLLPGPGAL
jgi:protein O-GlcNAc transferase